MEPIEFVAPSEQWETAMLDYIAEFAARNEFVHGAGGLSAEEGYGPWLELIRSDLLPETVRPGRVDGDEWLAVRTSDRRIVGVVSFRHRLNDYLAQFGGHIGYSVRPGERRKGYAGEILRMTLEACRRRGMERVLITCDKENEASRRTILRNGGVLENEVPEEEGVTQRYWITL